MLTFMSLEDDDQAMRGAKLKALKEYYRTPDPVAFEMLANDAFSRQKLGKDDVLVINSHGDRGVFAGYDANAFFTKLVSKGLVNGSFKEIYLAACLVGEQAQNNSIHDNFARDLKRIFINNKIEVKLYAPRGFLTYYYKEMHKSGQKYFKIVDLCIESPERDYPLDQGMLLVV